MPIYTTFDERALYIIEQLKLQGYKYGDILKEIGAVWTVLAPIKKGTRSFTIQQLIELSKLTGVSMDWICGLSEVRTKKIMVNKNINSVS